MTSGVLTGCEDGPNQTYNPSPAGAAGSWNYPDAAILAPQATQQFDAGYPTNSKTSLCSTDLKRQRWAWMLTQPLKPPRQYAGIDMAKSDLWEGLKIDEMEQPPAGDPGQPGGGLCNATPNGFEGGCPSGFGGCNGSYFGNNAEVFVSWNVATHLIDQMQMNLGYTGRLVSNPYPDTHGKMHSYSIGVGDVYREDSGNTPITIDWNSLLTGGTDNAAPVITSMFNAFMATYAAPAGVPFDTNSCSKDSDCSAGYVCQCDHDNMGMGTNCASPAKSQCGAADCTADGNCLEYNDGTNTIMGFRPLVVYVFGNSGVPQPALSTPTSIYNFFSKALPYSNLPQQVKLDADGPIAKGTPAGATGGQTCIQQIGQTFGDLTTNCVQVHGDKSNPKGTDAVNLNKITHGLTHDQEHYTANVLGVNQNFTAAKAAMNQSAVVTDQDAPQPNDVAQDWTFDSRAKGHVQNDYAVYAGKSQLDVRGTRLVFIEWARLMLADIARMINKPVHTLGDPACTGFKANGDPNYATVPGGSGLAKGCSGIEGMMIPYVDVFDLTDPTNPVPLPPPTFAKDPGGDPAIGNYDRKNIFYTKASRLKPGDVHGGFCIDPTTHKDCTFDSGLSVWFNAYNHVIRVLGDGDVNAIPPALRDRRYYYYWWGVAFTKYLKAYGSYPAAKRDQVPDGTVGGGLGPTDVKNQDIDLESFFFDYANSGGGETFDKFEYIDRDFPGIGAGSTAFGTVNPAPWDFEYGSDTKAGNQRYDNWYRRMDREEVAMFSSMLTDKTKTPGAENNVNITNLFGSDVLAATYTDANGVPSYACAIGAGGVTVDPVAGTLMNCASNPPLDPTGMTLCPTGACPVGKTCIHAKSHEVGSVAVCASPCDFTKSGQEATGCAAKNQACVSNDGTVTNTTAGCVDLQMDLNAIGSKYSKPVLAYYEGAWGRTPFHKGHSPITLKQADKHPEIGVAKITIPNFKTGPYTISPVPANNGACDDKTFSLSANKIWCNAPLNAGTGTLAPSFTPLVPWVEVKPGNGFAIPIDGQRSQLVVTGELDFTGVLETYEVRYLPYIDPGKPSCISTIGQKDACNAGFVCDPVTANCVTDDDTISIAAIEGNDFLGEAFVCADPATGDVFHVRMYDSALDLIDWLAAHPGDSFNPSAQSACQILVARTPYDNYVDYIVSKSNGVLINVGRGDGQGRVTDIVLYDATLAQAL